MTSKFHKHFEKPLFWEEIARELLFSAYAGDETLLPAVRKNLLHDGILSALHQSGLLERLVFHGGTALQRFYGNHRLSEDLDFALYGVQDDPKAFQTLCSDFEHVVCDVLHNKYHIAQENITVKPPQKSLCPASESDTVQSWKITIDIGYMQRKQLVKIDVSNIRALTEERLLLQPLSLKLSLAPFFMAVESAEEILVDKVIAMAMRNRVQPRDIYDFMFLASMRHVALDPDMLLQKSIARGIIGNTEASAKVRDRAEWFQGQDEAALDAFRDEMSRFCSGDFVNSLFASGAVKDLFAKAASGLQLYLEALDGRAGDDDDVGPRP